MAKLYVVATPIDNLNDLTPRMRQALEECDLVAAEDTRVTMKLMNRFELHKPMISCHRHNEDAKSGGIVEKMLAEDLTVALTCDGLEGEDPSGVFSAALWNSTMLPGFTLSSTRPWISWAEMPFQSRLSTSHCTAVMPMEFTALIT